MEKEGGVEALEDLEEIEVYEPEEIDAAEKFRDDAEDIEAITSSIGVESPGDEGDDDPFPEIEVVSPFESIFSALAGKTISEEGEAPLAALEPHLPASLASVEVSPDEEPDREREPDNFSGAEIFFINLNGPFAEQRR